MNKDNAYKMFEQLGYACDVSCDGRLYSKFIGEEVIRIDFDYPTKTVWANTGKLFEIPAPKRLTISEIKAIYKQMEELGWLDE